MINILCIIPARSGSKGIKDKNIKNFKGKPLLAWSIEQAILSKYDMKIVVSTDSLEYKKIAIKYGAEVPFLRPSDISGDYSTDFEFIKHTIDNLKILQNYIPDIILQLRPTQPNRKVEDINKCLDLFIENRYEYDSLRTVTPSEKSIYKMYTIKNNVLNPIKKKYKNIIEPYNQCRQILPKCYIHNGYIDILNANIVNKKCISGDKIFPYIMTNNNAIDIDTMKDWNNSLI